jgi:hypothetical protein
MHFNMKNILKNIILIFCLIVKNQNHLLIKLQLKNILI